MNIMDRVVEQSSDSHWYNDYNNHLFSSDPKGLGITSHPTSTPSTAAECLTNVISPNPVCLVSRYPSGTSARDT